MSLGWCILKDGKYRLDLPRLSPGEEASIEAVEQRFKEAARNRNPRTKDEAQEILKGLLHDHAHANALYLPSDQAEYLSKIALLHIYGFAFIDLCRKRYDIMLMNPPFGEVSKGASLSFRVNCIQKPGPLSCLESEYRLDL